MFVGAPVASLGTEDAYGRAASKKPRIVRSNLQRAAITEFDCVVGSPLHFRRQQRHCEQPFTVSPQDRSLASIGAEQQHDGLLAEADVLVPIRSERCAPHRDRRQEPIFASTPSGKKDQAARVAVRQLVAARAFLVQRDLTRLCQRLVVDQFCERAPRPKRRRTKRAAEELLVTHCAGERNGGGHPSASSLCLASGGRVAMYSASDA